MKKALRIKKNEEFSRIISKRHSTANASFVLYFDRKKEANARAGLSVSKKLGDAHVRNKIKRQIRMMLQETIDFENFEYDIILIVRPKYLNGAYADNKKDLEKILKQVKMK